MKLSNRGLGIALVIIGALVLIGQMMDLAAFGWTLFVIVPGAAMLAVAFLGNRDAAGLAVPGSIVTTVGLILLVQSATGTFHTWAYAWGLVLAATGFGAFLHAALREDEAEQRSSLKLAGLGLALFAGFGAFFELFVFGGLSGWVWRYVLPIALIVAGIVLLLRRQQAR
jgi:hypothetical protein